jgi:hypothetical protein
MANTVMYWVSIKLIIIKNGRKRNTRYDFSSRKSHPNLEKV